MYAPSALGRLDGPCIDVVALFVSPIGLALPVALSNSDQAATYVVGASANRPSTAAFWNESAPSAVSLGSTIGLMAGRYARPIASRRLPITAARCASAAASLY